MNSSQNEELVRRVRDAHERITSEIHKVIVGQDEVIQQIIYAMLSNGHALLVGVPGLGKTLVVKSIAQVFSLSFKRIQFTPDLMPADIYGTEIMEEDPATGKRHFRFAQGPIFSNLILADEINRTPPKTQAALLEAMEERHVTAGGHTHALDDPFFVLATQNPIELEGTYPLPEAQLDRFLLQVTLDYLSPEQEEQMVSATTSAGTEELRTLFSGDEVIQLQQMVREVPAPQNVVSYAVRLVSATRPDSREALQTVQDNVSWGAGSRASQALILTGKARALLHGRYNVACEDVRELALPVLRHRVLTNFHADAEGISATDIIPEVVEKVPE